MKKLIFVSAIFLVAVLYFGLTDSAYAMKIVKPDSEQENVKIESNEIIDDNLFIVGNEVVIRGEINNDVFVFGQKVKISGKVHGSVFAGANDVEISGVIDKDVFVGANFVSISEEANIGRDLVVGGNSVGISGSIGRNIWNGSSSLTINGKVLGNINAGTSSILVGDKSNISGKLKYYSAKELKIDNSDKINGGVEFTAQKQKNDSFITQLNNWFIKLLMALTTGIILLILVPKRTDEVTEIIKNNWLKSLGIGFLVFVAVPIIAMLLMILIIGLPGSLIIWALYFIIVYLAKIWVGLCLGKSFAPKKWNIYWKLVLGLIAINLIFLVPYIGTLVAFGAILIGFGGLYLSKPLEKEKI